MKYMTARNAVSGLILAAIFAIMGCIGHQAPKKPVTFYQLEYASQAPHFAEAPLPFVIRVEPFQPTELYGSQRIVYKEKQYITSQYNYHQWITPPDRMVPEFLARDLRQADIVQAVFLNGGEAATHRLVGSLTAFYENDQEAQWEAVAGISIALIKTGKSNITDQICFQKTYEASEISRENTPDGFVEAMSQAVRKISEVMISDIYNELLKQKKQAPERTG